MEWVHYLRSKFNLISILVLILFLSSFVYSAAPTLTDEELLDQTQAKAANYFYEQVLSNGFVKDTSAKTFSSIAATGFGLAAFTVMSERYNTTANWTYTPAQLRARTNQILDHIIFIQNNQASNSTKYGVKGLLFHWMDSSDNPVNGDGVSTVDNALLFAGVITAGEYFGGEVKTKADSILAKADWNYFLKTPQNNFTSNGGSENLYQFSMGWNSSGIMTQTWDRPTDEAILISLLAIASKPDNNDFKKSLFSWPRTVRNYGGYDVVNSYTGSLFTYLFAHIFVDFDLIGKDVPSNAGASISAVDWWQNSINAAKANRQFCIDNSSTYSSYGPDSWGLSAAEYPTSGYFGGMGALPNDNGVAYHNGTMSPYGGISTMPFFKGEDGGVLMNNLGFRVLRNLYDTRYDSLWGTYGPKDSFNQNNQYSNVTSGIDQGPIVLMIENYRTGLVQNKFMENNSIKVAIAKVFSCPEGICDNEVPVCNVDLDCGSNGYIGNNFCSNDSMSVLKTYRTFTCNNAGTLQAQCQITDVDKTQNVCLSSQTCSSGACVTNCSGDNCNSCVIPASNSVIDTSVTFCKNLGTFPNNVVVGRDNITIDCNGSTIGFGAITGRNNVTLKNCVLMGGGINLQITNSSNISVIDSNNDGSWDWGIHVLDSNRVLLSNLVIKNCIYRAGIAFVGTSDSNIINSTITNNGNTQFPWWYAGGLYFDNSNNNRVINNSITKNRTALTLTSSSNNYFENNGICLNKEYSSCSGGSLNSASGNKLPSVDLGCNWMNNSSSACDQSCVDSDDNIENPNLSLSFYVKGTVTFWDGNSTRVESDYCSGPDNNYMMEYRCSNGMLDQYFNNCEYGCVNDACVYVKCINDAYCNDNNYQTTDTCINPGTPESKCEYTKSNVACVTNAHCGTDGSIGEPFCNGLTNVLRPYRTYICNNGGTPQASCSVVDSNSNIWNCLNGNVCYNASCVMPACSNDIQCNDNNSQTTDKCLNPGTGASVCENKFIPLVACSTNLDCGINTWLNKNYCNSNNIWDALKTYTCVNPGAQNAVCQTTDVNQLKTSCAVGQICSNATCITPVCSNNAQCDDSNNLTVDVCVNPNTANSTCTHNSIACSNNTQCGQNGIIGKVCTGNYLYDVQRTFTCNNAGTSSAYCSSLDVNSFNQTCNYGCLNGACVNAPVTCSSDSECLPADFNKIFDSNIPGRCIVYTEYPPRMSDRLGYYYEVPMCSNPGTVESSCSELTQLFFHTIKECPYGCVGEDTCLTAPLCSSNSECNDNNPNTSDTCVNPGTVQALCNHTPIQITCSNNSQCSDSDPNTVDTCVNPATAQSYCTNIRPAIVCSYASQCGVNDWLGQTTCNGKNIGDYFRTYSCINPGKTTSYCKVTDVLKTKSYCTNGTLCSAGVCVTPACRSSSACNDSNPYTMDVCINPGKLTSACTHTPITCLTKADCDDGDGFTLDVCKNPKKTTSYCTHTPIACADDLSCNDNNPYTLDKCSRPNTTSSKCVYTSVKCSTNNDCDDFNPETSNICMKAGTSTSYCAYYPKIPTTIWSLSPNSGGVVFNSATCDVVTKKVCPHEMGWEGKKVTYKFNLPQGELTDNLELKFNVNYRNYGTSKNVLLKISAGSSSTSLKTVNASLEINKLGEFIVTIPKSYFKQGATNYIQLYGTNITPTGYGTNPPNFQISTISLNQVQ